MELEIQKRNVDMSRVQLSELKAHCKILISKADPKLRHVLWEPDRHTKFMRVLECRKPVQDCHDFRWLDPLWR